MTDIPRHPHGAVLFCQDTDGRVYVVTIGKPRIDWSFDISTLGGARHFIDIRASKVDTVVYETYDDFLRNFQVATPPELES